jgi:hypothetical protein
MKTQLRLWSENRPFAAESQPPSDKRTRAVSNEYFSTMKTFLSIILAVALSTGTALAKHGGQGGNQGKHGKHSISLSPRGGQGKHFSSKSPRGRHTFSRGGSKFSRGKSVKAGNWGGRNWSGGNWSGGNWSGDSWHYGFSGGPFIFIGGFGYPYYWGWYPSWGWSAPYAFSYGYDSYGYYPSYGYDFGYYSEPTYGYSNGSSIAQLQTRLDRAGYYHGAIDGIMGPATRRAIRAFERDYGRLSMQ